MNKPITRNQQNILTVLRKTGPMTPTKIGLCLGIPYDKASSYICRAIKPLVEQGLVVRDAEGKGVVYRLKKGAQPDG